MKKRRGPLSTKLIFAFYCYLGHLKVSQQFKSHYFNENYSVSFLLCLFLQLVLILFTLLENTRKIRKIYVAMAFLNVKKISFIDVREVLDQPLCSFPAGARTPLRQSWSHPMRTCWVPLASPWAVSIISCFLKYKETQIQLSYNSG